MTVWLLTSLYCNFELGGPSPKSLNIMARRHPLEAAFQPLPA